jgi:hypothetical protein
MYTREETELLVNAQSSKMDDIDTNKILDSHEFETYAEWECYALLNNEYDPRNFGKVSDFKGNYRNNSKTNNKHERDVNCVETD